MRLLPLSLLVLTGAAQQPAVKRTIIQRVDAPGSSTHEIVMAVAEFPPGAVSGWQRHPGTEVGYVLEGSIVVQHAGHPDTTLVAGNSFQNSAAHNARNAGTATARVLATYVVEKGKPLAEPVPAP